MLGYLFVRGVRALAYAKALEELTGADVTKMLPIPKLPDADFKEARPFVDRALHARLYRFSPDDFKDITAVWTGEHPIDGTPLEVTDGLPEEGGGPPTRRRTGRCSRRDITPRSSRRSPSGCCSGRRALRSPGPSASRWARGRSALDVRTKRIQEPASRADGHRVLVDRLWPRGISKDRANLDEWLPDVAPSDELRRWYGHDPARFEEFRRRYITELESRRGLLSDLRRRARAGTVTVLTATRDLERSNAAVLAEALRRGLRP